MSNNVLNTFWILFKSNADDVIKGNKAIEKSTKDTERALKNSNEEANKLGQSFVKMVEGAASAAGAIAGFSIMKNGILTAIDYNAQLKVMGDLTGQNAQTLKSMGQAAAEAGGSAAGALADIQGLYNKASALGLPLGSADKVFDNIRGKIKGMSPQGKQYALTQYGINDAGDRWLLSQASDEEYQKRRGKAASVSQLSGDQAQKAFDALSNLKHLEGAKGGFFTTLSSELIPALNKLTGSISDLIHWISGSGKGTEAAGAAAIGAGALGSGLAGKYAGKAIKGLFARGAGTAATWEGISGVGAAAGGAGAGVLGLIGAGVGMAGYGLYKGYGEYTTLIDNLSASLTRHSAPTVAPLTAAKKKAETDLDFWMKKGYTRAQAAAIMANMMQESKGNPNARGDGGHAHGLFQWHKDRRDAIKAATGIDVSTADYHSQLEAAAWEMKNGRRGFSDDQFRSMSDPAQAAGYFSQRFESPANGAMQALMRGKAALAIAGQFPTVGAGGGTTTVKIDKIDITTQATDATGIAKDLRHELHSQLSILQANNDDGVRA